MCEKKKKRFLLNSQYSVVKVVFVCFVKVLDGLLNRIRVYDPTGNYKSISEMDLAILWYFVYCK